jgi:hypothetical protein
MGGSLAPTAVTDGRLGIGNRLIVTIRGLPFGGWWVYVLVGVATAAWMTVITWLTHAAPVGQVDMTRLAPAAYGPYALALIQYLDGVASHAIDDFEPALGPGADSVADWHDELTTLPARPANIAVFAGLAFGVFLLAGTPPAVYQLYSHDLPTTVLLTGWVVLLGFAGTALLLYHTWHQLRVVAAIHAAASRIDPFRPGPLFAFSRLTARTGLGYVAAMYYTLTINAELASSEPALLIVEVLLAIAAFACFVLPLLGIHRRLGDSKAELVDQANVAMKKASAELYARVDRGEWSEMAGVDDTVSSLGRIRDVVAQLPTWPWTAGLFRGFLTAVLLPIVIWIITRVLGNVLTI